MSREQAEFIRAYAERVLAMPLEERAAYLAAEKERHDALGYAEARRRAAEHGLGDFGSPTRASEDVEHSSPDDASTPKAEIASFESPPAPPPPLVAYTDGSGTRSHLPSGAGVVVFEGDVAVLEASRHLGNGTNNHAELSAIRVALAITNTPEWRARQLIVRSDSMYAIGALTAPEAPREGAANERLITIVRSMLDGRRVTFEHVKGHSGIAGNERADELAGIARLRVPKPKTDAANAPDAMRRAG
jgi:ribonuclease HI